MDTLTEQRMESAPAEPECRQPPFWQFWKRKKPPTNETEANLRALVANCPERRADLYKFFQGRIEDIRTRLWTMLAWLAAADVGILAFIAKELKPTFGGSSGNQFAIDEPLLALVLAAFGIALSAYMSYVIDDGTHHIESNFRRSDLALGNQHPHEPRPLRARLRMHSFARVMQSVAFWTCLAHFAIFVLTLLALHEQRAMNVPG